MIPLLVGAEGLLLGTAWLARLGPLGVHRWEFLVSYGVVCLAYVVALRSITARTAGGSLGPRGALLLVGGVALLARILAFSLPESDDVYRYLWEGRLQNHGGNPYTVSPIEARTAFPEVAAGDPYLPRVNHPELTTIYPPLAELVFRGVTSIDYRIAAWKLAMLFLELALFLLLERLLRSRGRSPVALLAYAWHPLPVLGFAGEGHMDVLALVTSWLAIVATLGGARLLGGLGWGSAVASKLVPGVYLPAFASRLGWKGFLAAALVLVLPALPYAEAGWGLLRVAFRFGREMAHNSAASVLLGWLVGEERAPVVALALFTVLWGASWIWFRRDQGALGGERDRLIPGTLHLTGAFLVLAPTLHPWYLTWLVPYFVFLRPGGWLALSLTGGLGYLAYGYGAETGVFHLPPGVLGWEFGIPLGIVLLSAGSRFLPGKLRHS
ncbi:MAG: hypothetical protein R3E97_10720 [Candidatus Eisenbacteria bacterium]